MPVYALGEKSPRLGRRVFVAPTAIVAGDVELGDDVSFWFHSAVRGDVNWVRIGAQTNIQDGTVLHVTHETHPLDIGRGVVVGHSAMLHGCTVEDGALIGIGARVLDGAVIGRQAQIGAGAVVTPGTEIPPGCLALGIPARPVRELSEAERDEIGAIRDRYVELKERYRTELTRVSPSSNSVDAPGDAKIP